MRVPSDAGAQFFYRRLPASAVRQMYRYRNWPYTWHRGVIFSAPFVFKPSRGAASYDRRNSTEVHILRIDKRKKALYGDFIWLRNDAGLHPRDLHHQRRHQEDENFKKIRDRAGPGAGLIPAPGPAAGCTFFTGCIIFSGGRSHFPRRTGAGTPEGSGRRCGCRRFPEATGSAWCRG